MRHLVGFGCAGEKKSKAREHGKHSGSSANSPWFHLSGGVAHPGGTKKPTFAKKKRCQRHFGGLAPVIFSTCFALRPGQNLGLGRRGTRWRLGGFALDTGSAGVDHLGGKDQRSRKKRATRHLVGMAPMIVPADSPSQEGGLKIRRKGEHSRNPADSLWFHFFG